MAFHRYRKTKYYLETIFCNFYNTYVGKNKACLIFKRRALFFPFFDRRFLKDGEVF